MALAAFRVTVGTSAILLSADKDAGAVMVRNRGTTAIYVGAADVTDATGFQVDPGEFVAVDLSGESLWGISTSGSNVTHVLKAWT